MEMSPPATRTHGGRRPGSGGKPGNTNALKTGRYSPRYSDAHLIIAVLPPLRARLYGPGRKRTYQQLLDAAVWLLGGWPNLHEEVEELIYAHLADPDCTLPGRRSLLYQLDQRPPRNRRLARAIALLNWVVQHDPALGDIVSRPILEKIDAAPSLWPGSKPPRLKIPFVLSSSKGRAGLTTSRESHAPMPSVSTGGMENAPMPSVSTGGMEKAPMPSVSTGVIENTPMPRGSARGTAHAQLHEKTIKRSNDQVAAALGLRAES